MRIPPYPVILNLSFMNLIGRLSKLRFVLNPINIAFKKSICSFRWESSDDLVKVVNPPLYLSKLSSHAANYKMIKRWDENKNRLKNAWLSFQSWYRKQNSITITFDELKLIHIRSASTLFGLKTVYSNNWLKGKGQEKF